MPANIDSMFSVREVPWHQEGVILDSHPKNVQDALHLSGMDWEVVTTPIFIQPDDGMSGVIEVPDFRAVIRMDTKATLGIVGNRYVPVQNVEAFQFLDNLLGTDMMFETAGSLGVGEKVWVLSKIPDYIEVGGDAIGQYVLFSNSHNGKGAVQVLVTPIRVVCQNTLSLAIGTTKNKYNIRHTISASQRFAEARNALELSINYGKQFKELGDQLASEKITKNKLNKIIDELWPAETDRKVENREYIRAAIQQATFDGNTTGNSPGTKWSALNAFVEYYDHGRGYNSNTDKFARINFEPTNPKQKVFDLIVN